jgi:hypothetical protein
VRGAPLLQRSFDRDPDTLRTFEHFDCPESQDTPALEFHERSATCVTFLLKCVMFAVDLDDQLCREAGEVREVGADRMLPPKLDAGQPAIAKQFPANLFGLGAVPSELACGRSSPIIHIGY